MAGLLAVGNVVVILLQNQRPPQEATRKVGIDKALQSLVIGDQQELGPMQVWPEVLYRPHNCI